MSTWKFVQYQYPSKKKENFKALIEAVSSRGFNVVPDYPVLWINNTDYQWPDGLARCREIIQMYPKTIDDISIKTHTYHSK
jgi:hypothetical protein